MSGESITLRDLKIRQEEIARAIEACPFGDSCGALPRVKQLAVDLEALRIDEMALRESEAKYRRLHESMTDAFVRVEMSGKIVESNRVYQRMLGYTPEELAGLSYSDITPASWHEMEAKIVAEQIMPMGYSGIYEKEYIRKDGSVFPVELRTFLLRDDNGEPASMWAIVRDVTERKRAEEIRRQTDLKLLEAQKMESLCVMAGGIAHDFNNLLMGIMGNAELILADLPDNSELRDNAKEIEAASHKAAELCKQLLAYTGRGRVFIEDLAISDIVNDVVGVLRKTLPPSVGFAIEMARDLPPIHADAGQLRQMVMNLIINGIEAIGDRGGIVTISTGIRDCPAEFLQTTICSGNPKPGPYVWVKIADTGCGIDDGIRKRIFEPFFTTKFTGRGLGLSAALGIISSHEGALKLESKKGEGSSFFVLFPAVAGQPAAETAHGILPHDKLCGTVLLVDDDATVRELAASMLQNMGLHVFKAEDGIDAVQQFIARRWEIDLVILDLTMPRMNGEETLRELRAIDPAIRVIMSSGYAENHVTACLDDGSMSEFLPKPYTTAQLRQCVTRVISRAIEGGGTT